eukprot:403347489
MQTSTSTSPSSDLTFTMQQQDQLATLSIGEITQTASIQSQLQGDALISMQAQSFLETMEIDLVSPQQNSDQLPFANMRPQNDNETVFLDIEVDGKYLGRLTFELFSDTPLTSNNFKILCTGERGLSLISDKPLCYKGSKFHKIFTDYIIQGGDYTRGDGRGGESIYPGNYFADENYLHEHSGPGTLAMVNVVGQPNTNTSQFFISLCNEPLTHLNGKNVIFGKLKSGAELLSVLNRLGDCKSGEVHAEVLISDCGMQEKLQPRQQETQQIETTGPKLVDIMIIDLKKELEEKEKLAALGSTNDFDSSLANDATRDSLMSRACDRRDSMDLS